MGQKPRQLVRVDVPAELAQDEAQREESRELSTLLDDGFRVLAEAESVHELKDLRARLKVFQTLLRTASSGQGLIIRAGELKVRVERKLGKLLEGHHLWGGKRSRFPMGTLTLRDLGITKKQSFRCRLQASVPDEEFEQWVRRRIASGRVPSSESLMRLARTLDGSPREGSTSDKSAGLKCVHARLDDLIAEHQTFACILATPPWPQLEMSPCNGEDSGWNRAVSAFTGELAKLPVGRIAARTAHLHLYAPPDWLGSAMRLLSSWSFKYRGLFVLLGRPGSYGPYWRPACDVLVLGIRGHLPFRQTGMVNWSEVDGKKPADMNDSIMDTVELVSSGPYLSLFGQRPRKGWALVESD